MSVLIGIDIGGTFTAVSYTHLDVYKRQSLLRKTDMSKAYCSCHTDITIPYSELGDIKAVSADGSLIDIIRQGRFVLEGTEELNEALDEADDGAAGLDCE